MIKVNDVALGYGNEPVLRNISFNLDQGDVLMVTGKNGTGKSTLLRGLAGVLSPQTGTIDYGWKDSNDPRKRIGYLPDSLSIYWSRSVTSVAEMHWKAFGKIPQPLALLDQAGINRHAPISELSVGQRVLFHLSLILSTDPDLILIDEVLHQVDTHLRNLALEAIICAVAERNPAIVMVNLNYHEVENLVTRVLFLEPRGVTVNETADALVRNQGIRLSEILKTMMSQAYEGSQCNDA